MRPLSHRRRIIIGVAAVCCVVALSLLLILHDAVRGLVLDPFVSVINSARYTLGHMSQGLQWLIVILVAFLCVIAYVVSRLPAGPRRTYPPFTAPFPIEGPTMRLARIAAESLRYKHRRIQLVRELRGIAARVLAHHNSMPIDEAKESLDTTEWTDDASVRAFLSPDQHRAGRHDTRRLHEQVEHALTEIERMYREA
ncbi:hypothetical protein KJ567_02100 [Candidatus Bipolaricaulota bacterium]|nr:hypothetical protein [Candidatus Bipolaricaulota bacterium]